LLLKFFWLFSAAIRSASEPNWRSSTSAMMKLAVSQGLVLGLAIDHARSYTWLCKRVKNLVSMMEKERRPKRRQNQSWISYG
jgi:hypothetical protein